LFKGWITLSTGLIAIQWISVNKTNHAIHWLVIYPVDSVVHLLNNPAQGVIIKWFTEFHFKSIQILKATFDHKSWELLLIILCSGLV